MLYYVVTCPISSPQNFYHLLDVATLLWLYATERKCCDELAKHSSLTMALCNSPGLELATHSASYVVMIGLRYDMDNKRSCGHPASIFRNYNGISSHVVLIDQRKNPPNL